MAGRREWAVGLAIVGTVVLAGACSRERTPLGTKIADLEAQDRAPLEIVAFESAGGVGDAILGAQMDLTNGVSIRRHVLTVANVSSDSSVNMFRCTFVYRNDAGEPVTHADATPESSYGGGLADAIPPGQQAQLELRLLVPAGTRAECALAEVMYDKKPIGYGMWKAPE